MNGPDQFPQELRNLDRIVVRLGKQRAAGIHFYTFLDHLLSSETAWEKYRDSDAGNVINMQIISVENTLAMYCNRHWDDSGKDFQSIPGLVAEVERLAASPELRSYLERIPHELLERAKKAKDNPVRKSLRVHRSEHLAHLVEISRDRQRLFPNPAAEPRTTVNDLLAFAKETIQISEAFYNAWMETSLDFEENYSIFRLHCDAYWDNLPVFRLVE